MFRVLSLEALGTLLQLLPIKAWKVSLEVLYMFGICLGHIWPIFGYFLQGFRREVREFFGAISWLVRPSLPWWFGAR